MISHSSLIDSNTYKLSKSVLIVKQCCDTYIIVRIYMLLHIVTEFMQSYESKNVDDSFYSEFVGKSIFCIFENIS